MEQRGGKQEVKSTRWFKYTYQNGLIHSLIIHILLLLVLAFSFTYVTITNKVQLSISFEDINDSIVDTNPILSLETVSIANPIEAQESNSNNVDYIENNDTQISIEHTSFVVKETKVNSLVDLSSNNLNENLSISTAHREEASDTSTVVGSSEKSDSKFLSLMKSKIDQRLSLHGANTGDVQLSIAWDNLNDIDLWVVVKPFNINEPVSTIGWSSRVGINGGFLDIDMNVRPFTTEPVENIVWLSDSAPYGQYTVYIDYYKQWDAKNRSTTVYARIEKDGDVTYKKKSIKWGDKPLEVYTFIRRPQKK